MASSSADPSQPVPLPDGPDENFRDFIGNRNSILFDGQNFLGLGTGGGFGHPIRRSRDGLVWEDLPFLDTASGFMPHQIVEFDGSYAVVLTELVQDNSGPASLGTSEYTAFTVATSTDLDRWQFTTPVAAGNRNNASELADPYGFAVGSAGVAILVSSMVVDGPTEDRILWHAGILTEGNIGSFHGLSFYDGGVAVLVNDRTAGHSVAITLATISSDDPTYDELLALHQGSQQKDPAPTVMIGPLGGELAAIKLPVTGSPASLTIVDDTFITIVNHYDSGSSSASVLASENGVDWGLVGTLPSAVSRSIAVVGGRMIVPGLDDGGRSVLFTSDDLGATWSADDAIQADHPSRVRLMSGPAGVVALVEDVTQQPLAEPPFPNPERLSHGWITTDGRTWVPVIDERLHSSSPREYLDPLVVGADALVVALRTVYRIPFELLAFDVAGRGPTKRERDALESWTANNPTGQRVEFMRIPLH